MPADGYTAMFERILDHPGIEVRARAPTTTTSRDEVEYDHLVYTGPIDGFFDYRFGALPYRSLEFELRNEPTPDGGYLQPCRLGERARARTCRTRARPSSAT